MELKVRALDGAEEKSVQEVEEKLLEQVLSEAEAPPFFYFIPYVLRYNKKDGITLQQLIEALKREGFFASRTAFDHQGLKTSAAYNDLVDIINQF